MKETEEKLKEVMKIIDKWGKYYRIHKARLNGLKSQISKLKEKEK